MQCASMTVLNNTSSASTTHQRIHAFAMNGASMNWACFVAKICCVFVAFQGFVGARTSDDSKKYQPSLLEGRISRKRVAFDRLYGSRPVEYHDGYLIQLAYNQPLFVHFDNKRESLDKVAADVFVSWNDCFCAHRVTPQPRIRPFLGLNAGFLV